MDESVLASREAPRGRGVVSRLPRTHKDLEARLEAARERGYRMGRQDGEAFERSKAKADSARTEALKQVTHLTSVFGQLIGEVSRAMQSEGNQL